MQGKTLAMAVSMAGAVVIAIGMVALFGFAPPPTPERPKPPPPPESLMNSVLKYSRVVYQGLLEQDARTFHIAVPSMEEIARPNRYFEELKESRRLRPNDAIETPHLKLIPEVAKTRAVLEGQAFSSDHMILKIVNKTSKYLAYRIETSVVDKDKCLSKGELPHNAIVLQPNETISRTECMFRPDEPIMLSHIEVIELPALSAYYVSRLPPTSVLYDQRTSVGHSPLGGSVCPQTFSWREIREGVDKKEIGWRDVIDFYARHNCEEYSFSGSYRYRTDASAPLPVKPAE